MTESRTATVIYDEKPIEFASASESDGGLWIERADLARRLGWELKPQGLCRGEVCYPVTPEVRAGLERERDGAGWMNLVAIARIAGQPYASDSKHHLWYFGAPAAVGGNQLRSLKAPDFALPDLAGKVHRLSEQRGRKVFLLAWASW